MWFSHRPGARKHRQGCDLEADVDAARGWLRLSVPTPPPGSGCEEFEPGYVYAFTTDDRRVNLDPIAAGSSQRLLGMAAVPIVVHIPPTETVAAPTQTAVPPEDPRADDLTGVTYTDPTYGWTIEYPEEWSAGWFDGSNGRYVATGMFISSGPVQVIPRAMGEPDVTVPAEGEVMLKLGTEREDPRRRRW